LVYDILEPESKLVPSYPSFTPKGFCKEEYKIINHSGSFDLFVDKNKKVGENLEKNIQLNLSDQGNHTLDGLYDIQVGIQGIYTQWRAFCCSWNDKGFCTKFCHECDQHYKTEMLLEQLILTDYKQVSIEQPEMNLTQVNTTGFNEDINALLRLKVWINYKNIILMVGML